MKLVKPLVILLALAMAPRLAAAELVRHVPAAETEAGKPVEIVAVVPSTVAKLVVHYRKTGAPGFAEAELVRRDGLQWIAVVPAAAVEAPGLEYYLEAGGAPVFASPTAPHHTRVTVPAAEARRSRDEIRAQHRRWGVYTSFEWVDYGKHRTRSGLDSMVLLRDSYYRIDAMFSYRIWAYPLETLRFGYTRLEGETEDLACTDSPPCNEDAGFKVAGWVELGLAPIEGVGIDGRGMALATQTGFSLGGRLELRVGDRAGTHVASGVEYMADVGTAGFFRFGWGTVPKTPMAATVEITQLPASNNDAGVRFYYDIARNVHELVRLGLRAGYAARDQRLGGISGGVNASVDF